MNKMLRFTCNFLEGPVACLQSTDASATGAMSHNDDLAEQRADNVKQVLIETLFGLALSQNGNADSPALLSRVQLIMRTDGMGHTFDGINQEGPHRADVTICHLSHPSAGSAVADAVQMGDVLPSTTEQN